MKNKIAIFFCLLFVISSNLLIFLACGGTGPVGPIINTDHILTQYFDDTMPSEDIEFTHSILNFIDFDRIIPLGQINPPGHIFPTDHIYFVLNGQYKNVYAPAGGKILYIEETGMYGDGAIRIAATDSMTYYLGHIFVDENLEVGQNVSSGDILGLSGNTSCVDFGLLNKNIENNFLNEKYPPTTIYGDKPLSYYIEPLKSQLYSLVKTPTPPENNDYVYDGGVTDGSFAYDDLGSLLGNWFRENCFNADGWYDWEDTLSFGFDVYFPNQIRYGVGEYSYAFALNNDDSPIRPEDVSVSSGKITYYIYNANNTSIGLPNSSRIGLLIVQMISDTKLRLEFFEDTDNQTRDFTTSSSYYVR